MKSKLHNCKLLNDQGDEISFSAESFELVIETPTPEEVAEWPMIIIIKGCLMKIKGLVSRT